MKKNRLLNILMIIGIVYLLYLMRDLWGDLVVKLIAIFKPFIIGFILAPFTPTQAPTGSTFEL